MDLFTLLKITVALVAFNALFVFVMCLGELRRLIKQTAWYIKRERRKTIDRIVEYAQKLNKELHLIETCGFTTYGGGVDLSSYEPRRVLSQAVEFYKNNELSASGTADEIEKLVHPERFSNPHYVSVATSGISGAPFLVMQQIMSNSKVGADKKREALRVLQLSIAKRVNEYLKEREAL